MKSFRLLIAAVAICLCAIVSNAQDKLVFTVGSGVCTPITVNCGGRSYTVYGTLEVDRPSSSITVTAYDCEGNKLKYDYGSDSGTKNGRRYSISKYTFRNVQTYNNSSSGSSNYGGYRSGGYDSNSSAYRAGQVLSDAIFGLGGGGEGDAYPSLQARLGVGRGYGTFAKLRYSGYGFQMYASIGKDFFFDSEYKDRITWNAGIGSYFAFGGNGDPTMDIGLGLSVGQMCQYEKLCLMIDADYTYWIGRWRRVGLFAGGSIGWGDFTNVFDTDNVNSTSCFGWNLEGGIVIRLANF